MKLTYLISLAALCAAPLAAQDTPQTTPAPAAAPAPVTAPAPAAAPAKIADMFDAPPAGQGQIIFYRPGGMGALIGCMVREGEAATETHISKLTGNRYFVHYTTPGVHQYWVKSEATDKLNLEIEGGETYFVKCKIAMGLMVGRPNISPSDINEFEKYKAKLKLMDPKDQVDKDFDAKKAAAGASN